MTYKHLFSCCAVLLVCCSNASVSDAASPIPDLLARYELDAHNSPDFDIRADGHGHGDTAADVHEEGTPSRPPWPEWPNWPDWGDWRSSAPSTVIPPKDHAAAAMLAPHRGTVHEALVAHRCYFAEAVPRALHRVLTAKETPENWQGREAWLNHAERFGYTLQVWAPTQVHEEELAASHDALVGLQQALVAGRHDVAEHLMGLAALGEHGGLWIGPGALPPIIAGEAAPLHEVVAMRGLTLASNLHARDVGGMSAYITTSLMAAPPGHPWVVQMAQAAGRNVSYLLQQGQGDWPRRYFAGNTFLSRELAGVFHMLSFKTLQELQVFAATFAEGAEDALD